MNDRKTEYEIRIKGVISQLNRSQDLLEKSLNGVTQEASLVRAGEGGNHFNWLVGHIAGARGSIATAVGGESPVASEIGKKYGPGSPLPAGEEEQLERLADAYKAASTAAVEALEAATDEQLEAPARFGMNALGFAEFLAWHDAYHTGQAAVYRRLMGLGGVID